MSADAEGGGGAAPRGAAERLAGREAYAGRKVRLEVDRVRLPNGHVMEVEVIRHPGAAAIVALLGEEVLLVRQYRYATGGWLLEVPAGTLDAGERPAACAARELEEETGYRSGALEPLGWIWSTPGFTDERIWLFLATGLTPARQGLEHDEVLTVERLPFAEAVARAASGAIEDGKSVAALLRAAHFLRR
ncbi:MAG TPA: NUDIX hydrolase [Thermoanaerobaculia bacterium]|nr:NUDIX hydrolase [Thermoanaerobaculia bacterium]